MEGWDGWLTLDTAPVAPCAHLVAAGRRRPAVLKLAGSWHRACGAVGWWSTPSRLPRSVPDAHESA
jgi:hypothetical protein